MRDTFANAPGLHIDDLLADESIHIIVCTGAGGVGKTTTAAALGLRAAEMGRNVCVLTIDPASGSRRRWDCRHSTTLPGRFRGCARPTDRGRSSR